ncbi:MAG TPA: protein kinase [Chloroflexota bacterium]|jgi:tRNA A-37 threonylcarbamoyl transferase component Bud32
MWGAKETVTNQRIFGGRYRVEAQIADGGMARVYRATDTRLDRLVAIKVLREQFTSQEEFVIRFRQEARMAAGLAHPNIVGVYDVGEEDGLHYMVMEFVEGETLKDVIAREAPMAIDAVIPLMRQLGAALDYAHDHGVIHRDIKPENILLTARREVKVSDFGIARALAGAGMTATGTILGSVSYFSPEQASGQPAIAESDLYAAGMVLYEMLTRHLPFAGPNPVAVAMAQVNDEPLSPRGFRPDLSPAVAAVVLKAIAKNPTDRYHSGYELVTALVAPTAQRAAARAAATPLDVTAPMNTPLLMASTPQRPRRGTGGALVALLTTAALLIGAILVGRSLTGGNSANGPTATDTIPIASAQPSAVATQSIPVVGPGGATATAAPATALPSDTSPAATAAPTSTNAQANTATPGSAAATNTVPLATATVAPNTATPLDTATPALSPTAAATATAPGGTATLGPTNGATIDLVTAKNVGPHFVPVGITTSFSAKTATVYAVAQVHHKAKGANVLFTWTYPDGTTSPYLNTAVAPYPGNVTAYAEMYPRGPGAYSVTTSINGHVLGTVSFTVGGAGSGSSISGAAGTATPSGGTGGNPAPPATATAGQ